MQFQVTLRIPNDFQPKTSLNYDILFLVLHVEMAHFAEGQTD